MALGAPDDGATGDPLKDWLMRTYGAPPTQALTTPEPPIAGDPMPLPVPPPPPPPQKFDRSNPAGDEVAMPAAESVPSGGPSIADSVRGVANMIASPFSSSATTGTTIEPISDGKPPASPLSDSFQKDAEAKADAEVLPSEKNKILDTAAHAEDDALADKLRRDPIALNKYLVDQAQRRNDAQSAMEAKVNAKDREDALRNHQMMDQAVHDSLAHSALVDQESKALSNQKINAQFHGGLLAGIGAAIAATLGGAMSQYTGGKNLALEGIKDHIERDIAAQKDDIANQWKGIADKRNSIAEEYSKHGDMYRAQETFRLASLDASKREIQTTMQNFDPRGTSVAALAQLNQQTDAARAQALQSYHQQDLNNRINVAKVQNEYTKQLADEQQKKIENDLKRQGLGIDYAKLGIEREKNEIAKKAAGTEAALHGEALEKAQRENAIQEQGSQVRNPLTGQRLDEKGGKLIVDPTLARETNAKLGTAQNLLDSLGNVRRFLDSDPSIVDRTEWAKSVTELNNAKVAYIEAHKAKLSSREMQATEEVFGPDFDAIKDRVLNKGTGKARIDALIEAAKRETRTELKTSIGYTGELPLLDSSRPPPSAPIPTDEATKKLTAPLSVEDSDSDDARWLRANGGLVPLARNPAALGAPRTLADVAREGVPNPADVGDSPLVKRALKIGVPPSKIALLEKLADDARFAPDPKARQDALAAIQNQAENGGTSQIKAFAQGIMGAAVSSDVGRGR